MRRVSCQEHAAFTVAIGKAGAAGPTVAFAVTAGSLPPGLSLAPSFESGTAITGNPTQAGTFNFTMRLADYAGQQATQQFSLTINP